jgi:hypothetical protein
LGVTLPAITAAEIVHIPFDGDEILAVNHNGQPQIVLKHAFESIGLDADGQIAKLKGQHWATTAVTPVVAADGRTRDMVTCDVRTFLMALATIPVSRVAKAVRPKLEHYQSKVADVIEAYWTQGGAINPGATDEQLAAIQAEIEAERRERRRLAIAHGRVGLLAAMDGVDNEWRNNQYRHLYAIASGTVPDIAPEDRVLMVDTYLVERGVSKADLASIRSTFGKRLKAAYVLSYGEEPGEVPALINGRERTVRAYYERHRRHFDDVFNTYYSHLTGPTQLELGGAA